MRDGYSTASIRRATIYAGLIAAGMSGMAQVSQDEGPVSATRTETVVEAGADGLAGKVVVIRTTAEDFRDGRSFKNFRDLLNASEGAEAIVFDLNVSSSQDWEVYSKLLEELPKVKHYYDDAHPYIGQKVLVVGAANSACDVALETWAPP